MKLASFEAIVRALSAAGVRYLVAGGLAVNAHGYLRFTKDADLVIGLDGDNARHAMQALAGLGYRPSVPVPIEDFADPEKRREWIEHKNMQVFQLISEAHRETPVDVFIEEPFPFDSEYANALVKPFYADLQVPFVALDTLIWMKEAAGREQDRLDVEHLRMRLDDNDQA